MYTLHVHTACAQVKVKSPVNDMMQSFTLPLNTVGEPLARLTGMNIFKRLANSGLPLADVAYTQPLSVDEVALAVSALCVNALPIHTH